MSNQISAKVICDSINEHNDRITTIEAVIPRIVLAELNTHRMFSRNSASSRAIPGGKMIEMVEKEGFYPIKWMQDHKGMQGSSYFEAPEDIIRCVADWEGAKFYATSHAKMMNEHKITKQLSNRLLEPFMWHKVLITATDYENFISLRADNNAEIHIADFAYKLLDSLNNSTPKPLKAGDWHIPYGDQIDEGELIFGNFISPEHLLEAKIKIATARCAQTSYIVIGEDDKPMDYIKLIGLHDRLATNGHVSPFEHCAKAMNQNEHNCYNRGLATDYGYDGGLSFELKDTGWCGNFRGWIQYRKMLPNENRTDSRLIKHTYNG